MALVYFDTTSSNTYVLALNADTDALVWSFPKASVAQCSSSRVTIIPIEVPMPPQSYLWTDINFALCSPPLDFATDIEKATTMGIYFSGSIYTTSVPITIYNYVAKTSEYTISDDDYCVECTSGTFAINLPTAVGIVGKVFNVKNSGAGIITIDASGSQTIDGETTQTLNQYDNIVLMSNGANWIIL